MINGAQALIEPNGLAMVRDHKAYQGTPLVWDVTCVDTLALSHLLRTVSFAGATAAGAGTLKRCQYSNLFGTSIRMSNLEAFG